MPISTSVGKPKGLSGHDLSSKPHFSSPDSKKGALSSADAPSTSSTEVAAGATACETVMPAKRHPMLLSSRLLARRRSSAVVRVPPTTVVTASVTAGSMNPNNAGIRAVAAEPSPPLSNRAQLLHGSSAPFSAADGKRGAGMGAAAQPQSSFSMLQRTPIPYATADDLQQLEVTAAFTSSHYRAACSGDTRCLYMRQQRPHRRHQGSRSGGRRQGGTYTPHRTIPRMHSSSSSSDSAAGLHHHGGGCECHDAAQAGGGGVLALTRERVGNAAYQRIFPGDPFENGTQGGAAVSPATDVPWELRETANESRACRYVSFLSTRYFWFLIEWALRLTCIGILLPAGLINANVPHSPFFSNTFALSCAIIATGTSFGQSGVFFVQFIKAGCIWLPIATICSALKLNRHLAAWFVVYTVVLFLMATFTEKTTRRMCLLLYNISMVSLLSGTEALTYPSKVLSDWLLGAAFALAATVVPYPMLATRASAKISRQIFSCTATCFTGILACFWAPGNTERSMSMVRIRHLVRSIDHLIDKFDAYDVFTFYEVLFFERYERREVRKQKVELLLKLKMNLRAMERVINMVQEKPQMLDQSGRCMLFRQHLAQPMEGISRTTEAVLASLSGATMYTDLRKLEPYFEACGRAVKTLQDEFAMARRILCYEYVEPRQHDVSAGFFMSAPVPSPLLRRAGHGTGARHQRSARGERDVDIEMLEMAQKRTTYMSSSRSSNSCSTGGGGGGGGGESRNRNSHGNGTDQQSDSKTGTCRRACTRTHNAVCMVLPADTERMEEFVPLMTFFVFSIVNFWSTLREFQVFIDTHKPIHDWQQSFRLVFNALIEPFVENVVLVKHLCIRHADAEVRVVIEAAKVSVAMLLSVIFFYNVDNQTLLLAGPTIIAFVSGTNPVEAVQASAARLSGTLFGSVLGFFAATLCRTAVDRVAALCVITFFMTIFRTDKKVGTICMYCNFVAVSSLGPPDTTAEITISRIQQNTFAILIYCFISVVVFPVSPSRALFDKRLEVLKNVSATLTKLMGLLQEASVYYVMADVEARQPTAEEGEDCGKGLKGRVTPSGGRCGDADGLHESSRNDPHRSLVFTPVSLQASGAADLPPRAASAANAGNGNPYNGIVSISEIDTCTERNTASQDGRALAGMPTAFVVAPEDTKIQKIFVDIFKTLDLMKVVTSIMPLAADEFHVIPQEYPLRATGDVQAALYRLCALLYTVACSWKAMREKGYFTIDVIRIFHDLTPVATDFTLCMERFTSILAFYVRHPSSGLSSELTKTVVQLRTLSVELSARKERNLIAVIRKTRAEMGIYKHHPHRHRNHHARYHHSHRHSSIHDSYGEGPKHSSSWFSSPTHSEDPPRTFGSIQKDRSNGLGLESNGAARSPTTKDHRHPEAEEGEVRVDVSALGGGGPSAPTRSTTEDERIFGTTPAPSLGDGVTNETRIFGLDREATEALSGNRVVAAGSSSSTSTTTSNSRSSRLCAIPVSATPGIYCSQHSLARGATVPQALSAMNASPHTDATQAAGVLSLPRLLSPSAATSPVASAALSPISRRGHDSTSALDALGASAFSLRASQLREELRRSHQRLHRHGSWGSSLHGTRGNGNGENYTGDRRGQVSRHATGSRQTLPLSSAHVSREDLLTEAHIRRRRSELGSSDAVTSFVGKGRRSDWHHAHHSPLRGSRSGTASERCREHQHRDRRSRGPREDREVEGSDVLSSGTTVSTAATDSSDTSTLGSDSPLRNVRLHAREDELETEETARHADDALSLPYGSRESDMNLVTEPQVVELYRHSGGEKKSGTKVKVRGGRKDRSRGAQDRGLARRSSSGDDAGATTLADDADCFTLNHSSASASSSLVQFNDSFTTPVTVLDAEGLHAFTLSLEMLARELRKVLVGLEEMLQTQ